MITHTFSVNLNGEPKTTFHETAAAAWQEAADNVVQFTNVPGEFLKMKQTKVALEMALKNNPNGTFKKLETPAGIYTLVRNEMKVNTVQKPESVPVQKEVTVKKNWEMIKTVKKNWKIIIIPTIVFVCIILGGIADSLDIIDYFRELLNRAH